MGFHVGRCFLTTSSAGRCVARVMRFGHSPDAPRPGPRQLKSGRSSVTRGPSAKVGRARRRRRPGHRHRRSAIEFPGLWRTWVSSVPRSKEAVDKSVPGPAPPVGVVCGATPGPGSGALLGALPSLRVRRGYQTPDAGRILTRDDVAGLRPRFTSPAAPRIAPQLRPIDLTAHAYRDRRPGGAHPRTRSGAPTVLFPILPPGRGCPACLTSGR